LQAWDDAEKAAIAAQEDEEEGAEDLCNCEFSLAYGTYPHPAQSVFGEH
jgi:hypothetical protein